MPFDNRRILTAWCFDKHILWWTDIDTMLNLLEAFHVLWQGGKTILINWNDISTKEFSLVFQFLIYSFVIVEKLLQNHIAPWSFTIVIQHIAAFIDVFSHFSLTALYCTQLLLILSQSTLHYKEFEHNGSSIKYLAVLSIENGLWSLLSFLSVGSCFNYDLECSKVQDLVYQSFISLIWIKKY